ncbi:MAG: Fic family protein [Patescibacteria group bacterium]
MAIADSLLRTHVRQSNLIENIVAFPSEPLYEGHLEAARIAARGIIVHPNQLHRLVCESVYPMRHFAGRYRTCDVVVGDKIMPRWEEIPPLMSRWLEMAGQFVEIESSYSEYAAYLLHAWLLCIHPYQDGNGRTARLVWNMLRVNKSFSWHIVLASEKLDYYSQIRFIEKNVFRKENPEACPNR